MLNIKSPRKIYSNLDYSYRFAVSSKTKENKKNKKKQFNIGFIWFCLVLWGFA